MNNNVQDFTMVTINELFKEIEKTNRRIKRVKFMNKVYFTTSCIIAYALWKEIKAEVKDQIRNEKLENE